MGTWGNQCTLLLVCVAHSIPRGNIFLLFYYLNVNKLISFQSFAVVYPYDNSRGGALFLRCFVCCVRWLVCGAAAWAAFTPHGRQTTLTDWRALFIQLRLILLHKKYKQDCFYCRILILLIIIRMIEISLTTSYDYIREDLMYVLLLFIMSNLPQEYSYSGRFVESFFLLKKVLTCPHIKFWPA